MIPVLKAKVKAKDSFVQVDISVHTGIHQGLKNNELTRRLFEKHPLLRELLLILKQLLYYSGFNETFKGGLGSFGLMILAAAWMNQVQGIKSTGEALLGFLEHYALQFSYLEAFQISGTGEICITPLENYQLYLATEDTPHINLARNTRLDILLNIFKTAYSNLLQQPFCNCQTGSPLTRMLWGLTSIFDRT